MVKYVCEQCGRDWYTAVTQAEDAGRCQDCGGPLCTAESLTAKTEDRDDATRFSLRPPSPE